MGNHRYEVTAPCYYGGIYRTPTKHRIVVVDEQFSKRLQPSYLKLLPDRTEQIEADAEARDEAEEQARLDAEELAAEKTKVVEEAPPMTVAECKAYLDGNEVVYDNRSNVAALRVFVENHKLQQDVIAATKDGE